MDTGFLAENCLTQKKMSLQTDFLPEEMLNIAISDYNYQLPDEKIARYPLEKRDLSKLLVWKNGQIRETVFNKIHDFLPPGALLVFNNTRVIHARVLFRKESGSLIEIFCLEPISPADYQLSFGSTQTVTWKCLVGNAKKWKNGKLSKKIRIDGLETVLYAAVTGRQNETFFIEFSWTGDFTFARIIEHAGQLPIPPYLCRETEITDEINYQTIFARNDGSVAAPTAGLHFSENTLASLSEKSITTGEITLHVGAGTFQPVKSETVADHQMHNEQVIVSRKIITTLINHQGPVIAVGTTSVRSLESLYLMGVKLSEKNLETDLPLVSQWEPYTNTSSPGFKESMQNILRFLEANHKNELAFSTRLMILPGYKFRAIDGMVTNFHQPKSTLLLLISAFVGNEWTKIYEFALDHDFRFLSYGDANLYLKG